MTKKHVTIVHVKSRAAQAKLVRQIMPTESPAYTPPVKMSTLALARHYLGTRLKEGDDCFRLDGSPSSLAAVMRAANRVMHEQGIPQLAVNPAWLYAPPPPE